MTILIIEDNPANMRLVSDILKRDGYTVLEASTAEQGIKLAREELPKLILMDIQLPKMDGLTATKLLKAEEKTQTIPILALTSHAMKGDSDDIFSAGCDGYMSKPIRYKAFLEQVHSILDNKKIVG